MKLFYGWIVVAAGGLLGCVAIGAVFSLAVFLQPMADATGWSRTGVSGAMTIVFLTMGIASFGWGALTDRFGPLPVVLSGGVLLGLGLALASRAPAGRRRSARRAAARNGRSARPSRRRQIGRASCRERV